MGIPERKFRERAAMKKIILDAAHELYSEKGSDFTTIRKIAERIEYSPSTIYLYYPSKDLILYDMQKLAFESLLSALRFADADKEAFSRLNNLGKTYIDFGIQNPEKYDLMFLSHAPMNVIDLNEPWENFQQTFEILQGTIKECMAEKSVIYTDLLTGSLQFWCFLHGITSLFLKGRLASFHGSDKQNFECIYQAWTEYISGIYCPPASL